jgi:C4-dicarboxylate-specific signal transduction histidine kinase
MNGTCFRSIGSAASLGELAASIVHEVIQPLSGIIINASACTRLLESEPANVAAARETARVALRAAERASKVITRLRTLFGQELGTHERLDLNEVTREAIAFSRNELSEYRVSIREALSGDLPAVQGDRVQLQQVILNLLLNAAQAMSDICHRPRLLTIRTEQKAHQVRLSVQDVGVGFDSGQESRLFEAFYTTKRGGMGIGLSVSRSIIESHGGRMWAALNEGPGATFSFSIPHRLHSTTAAGKPRGFRCKGHLTADEVSERCRCSTPKG